MNKWYQTIIVNHKEEEGKVSHWFDDENYKKLFEEREEQLKEIERQKEVINGMIDNEEKYCLEINRLNNIINELEKELKEDYKIWMCNSRSNGKSVKFGIDVCKTHFYNRLQELKGSDKE